ncbi:MAG: hypothetical protein VZS44_00200 [Bacilli bacterium]|nr:hypothetical protein [Bacilli bacterium]
MNRGNIREEFLLKNMEQISMYANEERKTLKKIGELFTNISGFYDSTNELDFADSFINFNNDVEFIFEKRNQYVKVLDNTINLYNKLSSDTVTNFDRDV